jgi:antitoxin YefM
MYNIQYIFSGARMAAPHLATDIQPLAEFRAKLATVVRRLRRTRRPVVLTQHGRSAAVLVDVREYDALLERLELLQDVQTADKQLARGRGTSHSRARGAVLARLR